jgi:hypothetical protein
MIRLVLLAALLAGGSYFGYETVEAPGNQLFGQTLVAGSPTQREVALTFDDGPNPPYTDRILDVLKAERARDLLRGRPRGRGLPRDAAPHRTRGPRDRQPHLGPLAPDRGVDHRDAQRAAAHRGRDRPPHGRPHEP